MGLPFDLPLATARGARARLLVTVPKATDAPQPARARKKLTELGRVLPRKRTHYAVATPPPTKINHLRYPSSVMNCLYVALLVSSAYRYPNASRKASNF